MKNIIHILLLLTLISSLTSGQSTPNKADDPDVQRLKDCLTPDRPQPEVERGMDATLCGHAISLPKPPYPEEAKAKKVGGVVRVKIVIDEEGHPIWARGIEGHPLLLDASIKAACQSRHSPQKISGRAVRTSRIISYNFAN